jgi:hypothetical protein
MLQLAIRLNNAICNSTYKNVSASAVNVSIKLTAAATIRSFKTKKPRQLCRGFTQLLFTCY